MTNAQTEAQFQRAYLEFLELHGWIRFHQRPGMLAKPDAKGKRQYRTAVTADGKGFPDTVAVRERVVYAELKRDDGRRTPDQRMWGDRLIAAGQEYYCWRPADWPQIERVMGPQRRKP